MNTQKCITGLALFFFFNLGVVWGWVVNSTLRLLYPREKDPVPILQKAAWAPGPGWSCAENLDPAGIQFQDSYGLVASRYTDCTMKCTCSK